MDRRTNMKTTSHYPPVQQYPPIPQREEPPAPHSKIKYDRSPYASAPANYEDQYDSEYDSDDSQYAAYRRRRPVYDSFSEGEGDEDEPRTLGERRQNPSTRDRLPRRPETQIRQSGPSTNVPDQRTRESYIPHDNNYTGTPTYHPTQLYDPNYNANPIYPTNPGPELPDRRNSRIPPQRNPQVPVESFPPPPRRYPPPERRDSNDSWSSERQQRSTGDSASPVKGASRKGFRLGMK